MSTTGVCESPGGDCNSDSESSNCSGTETLFVHQPDCIVTCISVLVAIGVDPLAKQYGGLGRRAAVDQNTGVRDYKSDPAVTFTRGWYEL